MFKSSVEFAKVADVLGEIGGQHDQVGALAGRHRAEIGADALPRRWCLRQATGWASSPLRPSDRLLPNRDVGSPLAHPAAQSDRQSSAHSARHQQCPVRIDVTRQQLNWHFRNGNDPTHRFVRNAFLSASETMQ